MRQNAAADGIFRRCLYRYNIVAIKARSRDSFGMGFKIHKALFPHEANSTSLVRFHEFGQALVNSYGPDARNTSVIDVTTDAQLQWHVEQLGLDCRYRC
jgi:hypothetical protein